MAWARWWFRLEKVGPDRVKRRDHLLALREAGITPPEFVNPPTLPNAAAHLWRYFMELQQARQGAPHPWPFTFTEIKAWADLMGIRLEPWEVRILKGIDMAFISQATTEGGKA